jgi:PAS domain S-box-containing protein
MNNLKNATEDYLNGIINENIYQVLLDSLPCVAFIIKSHSQEVVASNHAARMVGICSDIKEYAVSLWHFEPQTWIGNDNHQEIEVDGVLWDAHWIPLHNDRYLLYAIDVTQYRKNEKIYQSALHTLDCYRKIFQQIPDAVLIISPEGMILDINDPAAKLLGYLKPELIGQHLARIYDLEYIHDMEIASGSLHTGTVVEDEVVVIRTKDNKRRVMLLTTDNRSSDNGLVIHTLVREKETVDNSRLEEDQARSVKLESLGHIASGVAHDFNNLIGDIYAYIDLASSKVYDQKAFKYLAKALDTLGRAKSLTAQLMTFVKDGVPQKRVEQLFPFIDDHVHRLLEGHPIQLHIEVAEGLWSTECDKKQIAQVIDYMVTNAIDAMPDGGTLSIKAVNNVFQQHDHSNLDAGQYIEITIKDDGEGIPTPMLTHIFDPFYTTKPRGRGLGLTACYSIVKRHGGCIDVYSYPGQGSTFTIYLPAVNAKNDSTAIASYIKQCFKKR